MKIGVDSNIGAFRAAIQAKKKATPKAIRKGVIAGTRSMYQTDRGLLSRMIYAVPIPQIRRFRRLRNDDKSFRTATKGKKNFFGFAHSVRQSVKAAWRRTSKLIRGERYYLEGTGANTTGVIDNDTDYTKPRHDNDRPSPVDGKVRRAPWRRESVQRGTRPAVEAFEQAAVEDLTK